MSQIFYTLLVNDLINQANKLLKIITNAIKNSKEKIHFKIRIAISSEMTTETQRQRGRKHSVFNRNVLFFKRQTFLDIFCKNKNKTKRKK